MIRILLLGLVLIVMAMACPAGAGTGDRDVKIIAQGAWSHLPAYRGAPDRAIHEWALRSGDELAKVAGQGAMVTVPKALKREAIDFTRQMLLVVEDGTQPMVGVAGGEAPSALYAVAITRIERHDQDRRLVVYWRRVPRAKGQGVLTRPLEAVLVDRFDGDVQFKKLPPSDQPKQGDPEPAGAEVKAVARAFWPDGWLTESPRQEWVVRSYNELIDPRLAAPEPVLEQMRKQAGERYAKALGVANIDFTNQMVVGVSAGVQRSGTRVAITRIDTDAKNTLTIHWRTIAPGADKTAEGIAHPAAVALIARSTADVRFQQEK